MTRKAAFAVALALLCAGAWSASEALAQEPGPSAAHDGDAEFAANLMSAFSKAAEESSNEVATPLKILAFFTVLTVLPSLLVMATSFTRIVIVLAFIRRALTTQTVPPTIVIVGLALFLTLFTMAPTFARIDDNVLRPYLAEQMDFATAAQGAGNELKEFMAQHTRRADLGLFLELGRTAEPATVIDVPLHVMVPAFVISELRTSFEMGFLLFIPFMVLDLVIASILLSTGMMMLPPIIISMPLKIMLFILVDGWHVVARALTLSFL